MPDAQAWYADGARLESAGRMTEAESCYRAAIAQAPAHLEAQINLGNVLLATGRPREALASFRLALELRPNFIELKLNIARALEALRQFEAAISCYRDLQSAWETVRAADLTGADSPKGGPGPGYLQHRIAVCLMNQGEASAAAVSLRESIARDPANLEASSAYLMALLYTDAVSDDSAWREHVRLATRFAAPFCAAGNAHGGDPDPDRRIRIGYVSGDFRNHSVAYFIEPVLARHDRSVVDVHCYDLRGRPDQVTHRLQATVEHWTDCSALQDEEIAERIRADGIDILVDLAGHSEWNRFLVFARRPAPIQLSWIGYPMGLGLTQIDYRLSDPSASPGHAPRGSCTSSYGEPLFLLPRIFCCYRPPSYAPEPIRHARGANPGIVLASFNNVAKVSDDMLRVWARIARSRSDVRLLLKDNAFGDEAVRNRFTARLLNHGLALHQFSLHVRTPTDEGHLATYGDVDIALDTFPYCGVTTTCEALWMGVPVVSLSGDRFASRMGATLLTAIGHSEWVVADGDEYARRVLALADNTEQLAAMRATLREQMRRSPLLDEAGFTRELESAFREMWRNWLANREAH